VSIAAAAERNPLPDQAAKLTFSIQQRSREAKLNLLNRLS
jgi:hypothetical protein